MAKIYQSKPAPTVTPAGLKAVFDKAGYKKMPSKEYKPYREASKQELIGLQKSYQYLASTLKEIGSKAKTNFPSLAEYKKNYEGSKVFARSDYIYELSKEVKRLTNLIIRRAETVKEKKAIATDFSPYYLDYRKNINDFIRQVESLTILPVKVIQSGTDLFRKNLLENFYGVHKRTLKDYDGNFNKLALNNLFYSMRQNEWYELVKILKELPPELILQIWKNNRDDFDLSFLYNTVVGEGTDYSIFLSVWNELNIKQKQDLMQKFPNSIYLENVGVY